MIGPWPSLPPTVRSCSPSRAPTPRSGRAPSTWWCARIGGRSSATCVPSGEPTTSGRRTWPRASSPPPWRRVGFERFDPGKGRFRTFLLSCLDAYAANELRAARRLKRGGGHGDRFRSRWRTRTRAVDELPLRSPEDPEALFQREWARSLFALAVEALRGALPGHRQGGRLHSLRALRPRRLGGGGAAELRPARRRARACPSPRSRTTCTGREGSSGRRCSRPCGRSRPARPSSAPRRATCSGWTRRDRPLRPRPSST